MTMERLQERIREEIGGWEQAYPLRAFPEPDLEKAATVLKASGMTLDAITASNMRHVVSRLAPSIHEAADALDAAEARIAELEALLRQCLPFVEADEGSNWHNWGQDHHRKVLDVIEATRRALKAGEG
jgi:hypothetical protein